MGKALKNIPTMEIDMTPMIDCVFQLLIFFMLTNQMVQVERALLELPSADQAKEEKIIDKKKLIINVHRDGSIEVSGHKKSDAELDKILHEEANDSRDAKTNLAERSVLLRADVGTAYKYIQKVLIKCSEKKIYKISFAAKIPPEKR
jgi:biopolymer transport protein ExbD